MVSTPNGPVLLNSASPDGGASLISHTGAPAPPYTSSILVAGPGETYSVQVWPLTQFFSCFSVNIIDLPGDQINNPLPAKLFSDLCLPVTPLSPSWTLERLFELTKCPSRVLNLKALLPELQRKKGHCQVCRAIHGGPWTLSNK